MTTRARRSRRPGVWAFIAPPLAALMLALLSPGATADGTTTLVSVGSDGTTAGDVKVESPSISADGRFVAFHTQPGYYAQANVYLRDVQAGTTTLVSVNLDGSRPGNSGSWGSSISASGRYVAFYSFASDLISDDENRDSDVFVRDVVARTTTLVSVNLDGTASGGGSSMNPVISADGRFVAFDSGAGDLTAEGGAEVCNVFVRNMQTGTTTLVSVDDLEWGHFYSASDPAISDDGRFVAFRAKVSTSCNLTNVFVRDMVAGTTTLVSANLDNTGGGNQDMHRTAISADGRFVAFDSGAGDLTADDTDSQSDVFVRDMQTGTTTLVSASGVDANVAHYLASISADGRFVAYQSSDISSESNWPDLLVRDLRTNSTQFVATYAGGSSAYAETASFTPDNRRLAFTSRARDLAPSYTANDFVQAYVRDLGPPAPLVGFSHAHYAHHEGGEALVTVTRSGDTSAAASVDYATGDGTAARGDYTGALGTLTFPAGETRQSFSVALKEDSLAESPETINLRLFNSSAGAGLDLLNTATLTIGDVDSDTDADGIADGRDNCPAVANAKQVDTDQDGTGDPCDAGVLQFSSTAYSVLEAQGAASVTVTRTGGSGGTVFASFTTRGGTAGVYDYTPTRQIIMFADGDTAPKTVDIPIKHDGESESSETVYIRLFHPEGGASIGHLSTAVLSIADRAPAPLLGGLTIVQGKSYGTGTVTLSGPAPSGGALVQLYCSAPDVVTVPVSVSVTEGATSAPFPVTLVRSTNTPPHVTITAAYRYTTSTAVLNLIQ